MFPDSSGLTTTSCQVIIRNVASCQQGSCWNCHGPQATVGDAGAECWILTMSSMDIAAWNCQIFWKLRQISPEFHDTFSLLKGSWFFQPKKLFTLNQGFDIVTLFSLHFCRNKVTDSSGRDRKLTKFFPGQTQNDRNDWDLLGNFPTRPGEQKKHCNTFQ